MDLYKYNFDLIGLFLLLLFNSLTMDVLRLWSTFFTLYGLVRSDSAAKWKASCFIFLLRKLRLSLSHRHLFSSIMLSNTSFSSILSVFSLDFFVFPLDFNHLHITRVHFVRHFGLDACNESWVVVAVSAWLTQHSITRARETGFTKWWYMVKLLFLSPLRSLRPLQK